MLIPVPPSECARAREAVSGQLDEELSELEEARLDAHLLRCPACREFAAQAAAITAELRRAPLEAVPAPVFMASRRPRVAALSIQAAAVAAVAVAAAGSLVLGRMVGGDTGRPQFTTSARTTAIDSATKAAVEAKLLALLPNAPDPGPRTPGRNGPLVPI